MTLFASNEWFSRHHRPPFAVAPAASTFQSAAKTHIGLIRTVNEDRLLDRPDAGLWAVADGMGGHDGGDVAATIAIRALESCANRDSPLTIDSVMFALAEANDAIRNGTRSTGISGCTIAGLFVCAGSFTVFWMGDSRVYRFRQGQLELLTHDHSMVQDMVDAKLLTHAQAKTHPKANVVTRALGVSGDARPDVVTGGIERGDRFLLCTDGLWGMLERDVLIDHMTMTPDRAVSGLTVVALNAGGRDNLAMIIVDAASNERS